MHFNKYFSFNKIVEYFKSFLKLGIEWHGFLPRNILRDENEKLWLIDFEDVVFFDFYNNYKLDSSISLKFLIAWTDVYKDWENCKNIFDSEVTTFRSKSTDNFEKMYISILGNNVKTLKAKSRCDEHTKNSETYCNCDFKSLYPSEVGHIIDENLPLTWSVFYTVFSSNLRKDLGETNYSNFIAALSNLLFLAYNTKISAKEFSLNLVITFECIFQNQLNNKLLIDLINKKV